MDDISIEDGIAIGLHPTGELEPELRDALDTAFLTLARDSIRVRNLRLRLQGDPLGLMDGDGISADNDDDACNAPTTHRAVRGSWDMPAKGKDRQAEAWRAVPIVEAMIRRGQIGRDDAQETLDAARRFYRDFVQGHRIGGLVAKWGDIGGGGGTPLTQQASQHYQDKNGVVRERLTPDERRTHHHTMFVAACRSIGLGICPVTGAPRPSFTLSWMLKLVCEDYSIVTEKTPTLEDCGRAHLGCKSPAQAMAAGASLVKAGLERLVSHYQAVDR